jgi:hypothetical protein
MMTPYAEKLLARAEQRVARVQPQIPMVKQSSKKMREDFRKWEAGFNAFDLGMPLASMGNEYARKGWQASQRVAELKKTGEFDRYDSGMILKAMMNAEHQCPKCNGWMDPISPDQYKCEDCGLIYDRSNNTTIEPIEPPPNQNPPCSQ